jgi:hypothetical protein
MIDVSKAAYQWSWESGHAFVQESYGTELALALAGDLENNPNAVFASVIAKDGPVVVSETQTEDQIVQVTPFQA